MKVRRGFIADEGKVFMSIDYSQVGVKSFGWVISGTKFNKGL